MKCGSRVSAALWLLASACSGTAPSRRPGDDVKVDVDASAATASPAYDDAGADSPFARLDGPYGLYGPDGTAGVTQCTQCACPPGTYCFGGGTGHTQFSGSCDQTDAASGLEIGCEALPGACGNEPDCACLFAALSGRMTCVPVCAEPPGGGFIFYCPVP